MRRVEVCFRWLASEIFVLICSLLFRVLLGHNITYCSSSWMISICIPPCHWLAARVERSTTLALAFYGVSGPGHGDMEQIDWLNFAEII